MCKISVISIAKRETDFEKLKEALAKQTFKDFEFITSTKRTIPQAWNDALSKAKGEIIVFTETDAIPLNNNWLDEIVLHAKKGTILKGLEIKPTDLDLCNLVCDADVIKGMTFDESFRICEDTEFFVQSRKKGIIIQFINAFPVLHAPSKSWRKTLLRAPLFGMNHIKIMYMYGRNYIEDVNTRNFKGNCINPISNRLRIITENLLILAGLFIGALRYLPILVRRKLTEE
jgi:glycosyltransferase involved in cell wall biosynthesis